MERKKSSFVYIVSNRHILKLEANKEHGFIRLMLGMCCQKEFL